MIGFATALTLLLTTGPVAGLHEPALVTIGQAEVTLNGPWRFQTGDDSRWAEPGFDDGAWPTLDLSPKPGAHDADVGLSDYVEGWWSRGFVGHEGYAWYRLRLRVNAAPGTQLALLAPASVEDAFEMYWNGVPVGGSGDLSRATPIAYGSKPHLFTLPKTGSQPESLLAMRVWMRPGVEREPDAGGVHIAPRIGEQNALRAVYQVQWLETIRGYVVDVVEPVVFLVLAGFAWVSRRSQASVRFAFWLAIALILTAMLRANQAWYFWLDLESDRTFELVKYALLEPLGLGAWMLVWYHWLRTDRWRALPRIVALWTVMAIIVVVIAFSAWPRTVLRVLALMAFLAIAVVLWRERRLDRGLALTCIGLVAVGQFAEELWAVGVPGIWFPFATGVSRTQFAYAALAIALCALTLRALLRAAAATPVSSRAWGVMLALILVPALAKAAEPSRWTPEGLSSELYESSPTFSPDGREIYFFRASRQFESYRLLGSKCTPDGWSNPAPPSFAAREGTDEADPFVTADGKRLYYASARKHPWKLGSDDFDIWSVERLANGAWGLPQPMPAPVNSSENELLPRMLPDGRLIFGSRRPGGYGEGDIYIATARIQGGWRVENLGPPVSSAANELEAEMSRDGSVLIVVSSREARWHLYRYERSGTGWIERGRVPANDEVFQVGPLLSPSGDKLLFAQATSALSGEIFLTRLAAERDPGWPPRCERR